MRFGLFIPQGWRLDLVGIPAEEHWPVMRGLADYADRGGWDSLWVYDHFHTVPMPTDEATHEAWTMMAAFASTSRIKLGQMCTAMSYRNPVYLAKVAGDHRHHLRRTGPDGIGGGWFEHSGGPTGTGSRRRGAAGPSRRRRADHARRWRDGRVTFDGKQYQVNDAIVAPKPLQPGGIPLWIAGGGRR